MIKKIFILLMIVFSVNGAKYHQDSKGVEIHTPFRWVVANSTARGALTVTAQDTQKLCFQIADTTIWMLSDNSPKRWTWVSGKKVDSLYVSGGLNVARATIGAGGIKSAAPCTSTVFNASSSTASRVVTTDANKNLSSSTVTLTELGYLSGKNSVIDGSGTSGNVAVFSGTNRITNGPAYNSGTSTFTGNVSGSSGSSTTATNVSGGTANVTTCNSVAGYQFNGGSTMAYYKVETLPCSLFEGSTYIESGTAFLTWIDNLIFITFPEFLTTVTGGATMSIRGIPAAYLDSYYTQMHNVTVYYNGKFNSNYLYIFSDWIYIRSYDDLEISAGFYNMYKTTVTYRRL